MAALGTVAVGTFASDSPALISAPITSYTIKRGTYLGTVNVGTFSDEEVLNSDPISFYKVRQLIYIYQQLWLQSGQRWPVGNSQFPPVH